MSSCVDHFHVVVCVLQVSALEAQLRETQLIAEKKLLSVTQEAEAVTRHERLTLQQEVTSLQVSSCMWFSFTICITSCHA